jgi:hypothetical protein
MYQHELIGIMNMKLLQAIRNRESINDDAFPEEHGYWHGMYKAYEEMIQMLTLMDIRRMSTESPAVTPIV